MKNKHIPVLQEDVVKLLAPKPGESYLDGTAGYGGHAEAIMTLLGKTGRVVLVDRDANATRDLAARFGGRVEIMQTDYLAAAKELVSESVQFDMILLDLGVSSPQLDDNDRGFSFKSPNLDMRMDQSQDLSAAEVVNTYPERRLADIIYQYGEERHSRGIARSIVAHRPITTASELAQVVRGVVKGDGKIDGATRTFQAIRIEVNAELTQLEEVLPLCVELLTPGGRLAVISFHSLEDRIVKQFIDTESRDCICPPKQPVCTCGHLATLTKLTTKVVSGSSNDVSNPRARSAKLRAAAKINQKQKEGSL
jgi:16S rRNA (cytosine1402-N4)-methyltransferase